MIIIMNLLKYFFPTRTYNSKQPVIFEYIWLDIDNNFRSKTRVIEFEKDKNITVDSLPIWNYDGSSTGQTCGSDSEIFLKPQVIYLDPFIRETTSYLVLCSMYRPTNSVKFNSDGSSSTIDISSMLSNSNRALALKTFSHHTELKPWFGIEQEYFITDKNNNILGFDSELQQGKFYCGVNAFNGIGRKIAMTHLEHCLYSGIKICGVNAEVAPSQWEYQIGICEGIEAGDHVWISRYILCRVAEMEGYNISFHPKPLQNYNGSGCHTNFSTLPMREEPNGISYINLALKKLERAHDEHMAVYGNDNRLRMSGLHETSHYDRFTIGRGDRGCSIRVNNDTINNNRGYFEDRRPAANCDPYIVTSAIFNTLTRD